MAGSQKALRDPMAKGQAWVSGGTCHHRAQNNLLPLASLPFQRPEMIKKPNAGTLEGLKPALNTPVPVFEDFPQRCFGDLSGVKEGICMDPSCST